MLELDYTKKLNSIIKQRNIMFLFCAVSFVLITVLIILLTGKSKTVVLVPSGLQTEMRISSSGTVSRSYTEQFTRDIVYTMLNITPSSISYSNKAILEVTSPKLHKDLSHQFEIYKKDIVKKNISTFFALHKIVFLTQDNLSVKVEGQLSTFIGKDLVSKETKKYHLRYRLNGTVLYLVGFKEIKKKPKDTGKDGSSNVNNYL